ncbi:ABC transporter substrate-binding protein [Effusibacillus lacus]|uniref:Ethanolamine utilization protein EutJ n=1 Tax=Effusibacillus lacus TaxID=1348429 RepID=A0A292YD50_9BACL|nr:ABC transporter substrate-binding protein [Effusibacillus lacus]TCS75359.1 amino acid/amide ABC transporter substrate-binding protein (HAAT family) [Effusibacillus lacus]GAX89792.1 ethanolamine utilization protein EutJ [Effusibacillus lacus]
MQRKWKSLLATSAAAFLLFLTACGSQPSSGGGGGSAGGGQGKVVNIGWSGPQSGGAALYGKNTLDGLEMAVNDINAAGGIKVGNDRVTLKLVALDDKYLPNETATNARRLKTESKATIIFTPHSGGTFAMQQFNVQEKFLVAAYTSEPKVTEVKNPLTVRIPPRYDIYPKTFSEEMIKRFGKKAALVPGTHQYAKDWSVLFKKVWTGLGGEIVAENPVDYNKESDFAPAITKALAGKPDVLFVGGASQPTALVIKTAREQGFKGGVIMMDQAKVEEVGPILKDPKMMEGVIGVAPASEYPTEGTKKFVEAYKKKFGADKIPTSETAYHYMAMHVFAKAMELAGTTDDPAAIRAKIDDACKQLTDNEIPSLAKGLSEDGALNTAPRATTMKDGKFVELPLPTQP